MALFKILKGEGNLPSTKNEGWAYVRKTGSTSADFYVDYDQDTRLQIGRYAENGIFYIDGTGTTAGAWLGSHDGITEYYDGLVVLYRIPIKGATTTTLNINGLGAKTCYVNSDSSKLTTHYPATGLVLMVYDTTLNSGAGGWKAHSYRDTNTTYTLSGAASGDTWVTTLTPSSGTATTSTVPAATATAAGLMTAADKAKLDAIPANATNNTGDITGVSAGIGLAGGATSGNATLKANLRSETKLTVDSAAATTTSGRVYPVAADKSGYLAVNVPWSDTDTGATSVEVTGTGNAITAASYDSATRKLTLTKGATYSNNKGDITGVTAGKGLTNGGTSGTVTLNVGAGSGIVVNDDDIAVNTSFSTSGKNYGVQVDETGGGLYVNVPWTDTNTDTHYTTKIFAGSSGTAQNEGTTISNPYIKVADTVNGTDTYRNQIQVKGGGATTVKAQSGVITISTPAQSVFTGASASAAGTSGLVPQPTKGQEGYYLRGDGKWYNLTEMDSKVQDNFQALKDAWESADTSLTSTLTTLINGKAQTNHASTGTSYGVSSATNYGHAKASGTTPKASAATAAVGSETASFARGDHVHPLSVSHSWNGTTLTTTVNGVSGTATLPNATTSVAGIVTTANQSFGGFKHFSGTETKNTYYLGSYYSYDKGCLIDIGPAKDSTMVVVHVTGNSYNGQDLPINSLYQFYDYGSGTIMQASAMALGHDIGAMKVYRYNNRLYAYVKQAKTYCTLAFTLYTNKTGLTPTIINSSEHASGYTDLVTITPSRGALATSGVTAGTYGLDGTATPAFGDSFIVPKVTVDTYGRVTSANEYNVTIPNTAASQSAAGLMSAADKKKLDGIAAGATANTGDITGITTAATSGLTGGVTSGTATLAVNTSYTTSGKNYAVKVDSTSGGLYVNVPWTNTDTNTNYYHTPDWASALASGQGTATGGTSTNIKIATGTGKNDMYVPVATNSKPGLTIVYPKAQCSTYASDTGAVTPAAAKQAVTKFAKETIGMPEENTMADYVLASGDTLSGSLTFNNSSSTAQKDQPHLVWKTVGSNTPRIGYASDQNDGTFLIASLGGTTYQSGLAIGGGSGNLLWKGKKVLTVDDSYSHPAGSGASKTSGLYKFSTDSTSHISGVTAVTKADITALGIPAQDTTYSAATSNAAGLMSAADKKKLNGIATGANKITVDTALSTTSTNPVQNKVVTTAINGKADLSEGAIFVQGSGTTNSTAKTSTWLGTSDKITAYYDGLTIRYKIGVAGQSTTTLNINNLGAKTVYRFSNSKLTTHFPVNSIIHLIYHADLNGGCWMCSDYDANTNTYQRVYASTGNVEYPITTRYATTTGASYYAEYGRYSTGVTLNPSTNTITATNFKGLATKATADASGNVITDTYATKAQAITGLSVSGKVITYTKGDGTTGTITTQDTNTHAVTSVNSKTGAVTLTYSDVGAAASSHNHDDRYYTETEVNTKLNAKLNKLTYEWNKEYSAGGTAGYLLIGSFPMYDTNVTIDIDATTNTTYHGTVVIATQNVSETSIGSAHTITVYGDPTGTISDAIKVVWTSGSRNYNVYFVPSTWSKNLIHIRAIGQYMDTIDESKICTQFTAGTAPATTTGLTVVNALKSNFNNYVHPTSAGNKHIPAGGSSGQILKWSAAGTAAWANDHSAFSGASASAAGTAGLVPAPAKGQQGYFLRGDGTWYNFLDLNSTALDTISEIKTAWETADGTLKSTLETAIGNKVSKTGDTMSGSLTVNANITASGDIKGGYLGTTSAVKETSLTDTRIAMLSSAGWIRHLAPDEAINLGLQQLDTGSSTPQDGDYFISQYAGGGTSHPEFYRRPVSTLWTYMDGKVAAKYAKLTSPNNMIHNSNETTWVPDNYNNYVWINYRSVGGTGKSTVTGYKFGNANGTTENVFVEAATFSMNDKAKMTYNATDECIEFIFA